MKRSVRLLVGVVVALVSFASCSRGGGEVTVDFIERFESATDKRPNAEVFEIVDATIGGETKPAILVKEPSRLVYSVVVPDDGELRVSLGLLEEAWTIEGDGVLFRVLVGAGGPPEEVLNVLLNPYSNRRDRGWQELPVDLSEYSGETVDLYFNTNSSPPSSPSQPPQDNRVGDLAVWGAPRLIAR